MENVEDLPTTPEVLHWLLGLGLVVTEKQIANDTVDRFLPPRPLGRVREGRGRTGRWEPWMVRRAERLYRLRRRKDPDGQPLVYGDTLRLLLFIRDGWGWSHGIRDLCLRGFEKSVAAILSLTRRYVRRYTDRDHVEAALDVHEETVSLTPAERYAAGVLAYQEPLEGGSLRGVFRAAEAVGLGQFPPRFIAMLKPLGIRDSADLGDRMALDLRFTAPAYRDMLNTLDDRAAQLSMSRFVREFIRPIRSTIHRAAVEGGQRGCSTNLFTMCGHTQREIEQVFRTRRSPKRITPAQALALFLGTAVLGDFFAETAERLANFALDSAFNRFGMKPPTNDEQVVSTASEVMRRVFGASLMPQEPMSPK